MSTKNLVIRRGTDETRFGKRKHITRWFARPVVTERTQNVPQKPIPDNYDPQRPLAITAEAVNALFAKQKPNEVTERIMENIRAHRIAEKLEKADWE